MDEKWCHEFEMRDKFWQRSFEERDKDWSLAFEERDRSWRCVFEEWQKRVDARDEMLLAMNNEMYTKIVGPPTSEIKELCQPITEEIFHQILQDPGYLSITRYLEEQIPSCHIPFSVELNRWKLKQIRVTKKTTYYVEHGTLEIIYTEEDRGLMDAVFMCMKPLLM